MDIQQECNKLIARAGRAYAYMMGTLDSKQQWDMWCDLQNIRGIYCAVDIATRDAVQGYLEYVMEIEDGNSAQYDGSLPIELLDKLREYGDRAANEYALGWEQDNWGDIIYDIANMMQEYMENDGWEPPGPLSIQAMLACEKEKA